METQVDVHSSWVIELEVNEYDARDRVDCVSLMQPTDAQPAGRLDTAVAAAPAAEVVEGAQTAARV